MEKKKSTHKKFFFFFFKEKAKQGICDGPGVKNLLANAGNTGSVPGLGRFHLSWATKSLWHNYWACALEPVLCKKGSLRSENPPHHN